MHGTTQISTSTLAPGGKGGGGGISCHIKFSQQRRRWGMSPHSNLLHTQQVLTSRLNLACCDSNSTGRQCLIRMYTDSLYPVHVFPGSEVLPLIRLPVNQGFIEGLLERQVGNFYPAMTESCLMHILIVQ